MFADPISAIVALFAAYATLRLRGMEREATLISAGVTSLLTGVVALGLMARAGQYSQRRRLSLLTDVGSLLRDLVIGFAVAALLAYLTRGFFTGTSASRLATGGFLGIFFVLGTAWRLSLKAYQQRQFAHGRGVRKILVIGSGAAATDFVDFVYKRPWLGVAPAGMVRCKTRPGADESEKAPGDGRPDEVPVIDFSYSLQGLRDLDAVIRSSGAAEVVVALDAEDQDRLPQVAELLTLAHVPFKVIPSLF
jgi:FlaA1/EpsC-like NDP-sugar epimerase